MFNITWLLYIEICIYENRDFDQTFLVVFTVISSPLDNGCQPYDLLVGYSQGAEKFLFLKVEKAFGELLFHFWFPFLFSSRITLTFPFSAGVYYLLT